MKAAARELLRCPFCTGAVRMLHIWQGSEESIRYGLLGCDRCRFEYPIVAGIALIRGPDEFIDIKAETTADILLKGPQVRDLVELLKAGRLVEALGRLLGPTSPRGDLFPELRPVAPESDETPALRRTHPPVVNRQIRLRRGGRLLRTVQAFRRRRVLPRAQLRLAQFLESQRETLSAMDVIDLFYRQYSGVETSNYFTFRFGQPRHLAALSLASLLHRTTGPILDLACGLGHLTHTLTQAHPGRTVIGLDRDFFRLYVASQFVAPGASYLCTSADQSLPFAGRTLGGIFCSDAFHYFLRRAATVRECQRHLADDGILILCRFGNLEVDPHEGYELTLESYRMLFDGWPQVVLGEDSLVNRYLTRRGPDLSLEESEADLRSHKWLSLVAAPSLDPFRGEQPLGPWPHALGRLQLNPLYLVDDISPDGATTLHFEFPSPWYEFENRRYLDYAPRQVNLSPAAQTALKNGQSGPMLQEYIDQFVVLGMPERYCTHVPLSSPTP